MRRAARRVVPASGPRHHDDSRHLIASITCRRTPLPVPQPRCRIAAKHPSRAAHLAKIALSKTAAPSLRPLQSVSHGRLRRPTHRSQRPPGRQIAIDGNPHAAHRGFLPWRLSDAGPQCPLLDCEWAGIRNPSQLPTAADLVGLAAERRKLPPAEPVMTTPSQRAQSHPIRNPGIELP